ncbi:MAG: hypothetical protein SGPRY_009180, partial [Prymnesium sp.]
MARLRTLELLLSQTVERENTPPPQHQPLTLPHSPLQQSYDEVLDSVQAIIRESTQLERSSRKAREARIYYKVVAKVGGRFFSVFDGRTEFRIGERIERERCHGRKAAFFVHSSAEAAQNAQFPAS